MSTPKPNKFSFFVEGIVDRKILAVSLGFSNAANYLSTLTTNAATSAASSANSATAAAGSSANALVSYNATALLFQNFQSLYLGVKASDPTVSGAGKPISAGAFYVRSSDLRLRVVTSLNNGAPVWGNATVVADQTSVLNIVTGKFLSLSTTDIQSVNGPVRFLKSISVIDVTDWASSLPVPAKQVQSKFDIVQQTVYAERDRAQAAEQSLRNDINAVNNNANAINDNANTRIDNLTNYVKNRVPVGVILLYAGSSAPGGWAICDGGTYSREDGTGNIQTPDLRNRVPVGASGDHPLGSTFGSEKVSATTSSESTGASITVSKSDVDAGSSASRVTNVTFNDATHSHTITDINVVQPSIALNYIMKL